MKQKKNVTFSDIAEYTNFSKTTISRYFNNPDSLTLENQEIIAKALVDAYGGNGGETGDPYKSLYWSETGSSASGWEQAVSVMTEKNGGTFKGSDITRGGYFYVEYDGTQGGVEFILQNFDSKKWAKVTSSESGSANGHYYAKFSYDNCVAAFGTDNFNDMLDQIHVGATDNWINVYSVCYCYPN